jgi:hypothetical protein
VNVMGKTLSKLLTLPEPRAFGRVALTCLSLFNSEAFPGSSTHG